MAMHVLGWTLDRYSSVVFTAYIRETFITYSGSTESAQHIRNECVCLQGGMKTFQYNGNYMLLWMSAEKWMGAQDGNAAMTAKMGSWTQQMKNKRNSMKKISETYSADVNGIRVWLAGSVRAVWVEMAFGGGDGVQDRIANCANCHDVDSIADTRRQFASSRLKKWILAKWRRLQCGK